VLVLVVAFAGFASPLVVLITFAGSLCCALSIGQFADRLPSAGWAYTYNSRGLGPAAGFLTGWMMIFAYALFVPAGVGLTSAFGSQLLASTLHVTIAPWALFIVILTAVVVVTGVFYLLVVCAEAFALGGTGSLASSARPARWAIWPAGSGRRRCCGASIWSSCSPASALSWPRSTRRSGSCTRWDANEPCPGRSAGCRSFLSAGS